MRMITTGVSPGPEGFEQRSSECLKCGHVEQALFASSPLNPDAEGRLQDDWGGDELKSDD
jgi:hypothetical protein